jgi:hypothetical protein
MHDFNPKGMLMKVNKVENISPEFVQAVIAGMGPVQLAQYRKCSPAVVETVRLAVVSTMGLGLAAYDPKILEKDREAAAIYKQVLAARGIAELNSGPARSPESKKPFKPS